MPEAILARELEIDYASICMVVNSAAGLGDQPISEQEVIRESVKMASDVSEILVSVILSGEEGLEREP